MDKGILQEKFAAFKKQVEKLRGELQKVGEQFLIENFKKTFEKYPMLERVSWTQYTPYFNDGDECTFRSNHEYADIEGLEYGTFQYEEVKKQVREFLSQLDDELMQGLFGNHVKLIVTKEGISINEYIHD